LLLRRSGGDVRLTNPAAVIADLKAQIENLPEAERKKIIEQAIEATKHMKWVPNPGPQTLAYFSPADIMLYGGQASGGKALCINELVLAPSGWRRMGDLKVGDRLCATDGTLTEIMGVYPQPKRPLYRITFHDGTSCVADLDHNWLGWWTGKPRKINNVLTCGVASAAKHTTADIIAGIARYGQNASNFRFAIPTTAPVIFNVPGVPRGNGHYIRRHVDPYLLGLLIGDGSLSGEKRVALTTADQEIEDYLFSSYAPDVSKDVVEGKAASTYRFKGETLVFLQDQLSGDNLGLHGHKAEGKFIPRIYLFGTIPERWALLQGLMDSDGWAEADGDCYYCSVSKRLADDVAHLARSLGAVVCTRDKIPTYEYKGARLDGQRAYTLSIKMPDRSKMFRLSRKIELCGDAPKSMAKYVESVEYERDGDAVCIQVRHPSSLYITRDFTVTHNTDLGLGLAFTAHRRSLVMRRRYPDLSAITDRAIEINGTRDGFNGTPPPRLTTADGRLIEFGAVNLLGDEQGWMGRPHDFKYFDEATQFAERQIRFLMGWLRTTVTGQRTRAILGTNPPLSNEGEFVVGMFRPWLDITHPNPAKPGELRWFVTPIGANGKSVDVEVAGPGEHTVNGEVLEAHSRTFIPAKMGDNPFINAADYKKKLDSMEEPFRSAIRDGNFMIMRQDSASQLIPSAWIQAAMDRWRPGPPPNAPMSRMGLDPAGGGPDATALAYRHDGWYGPIITKHIVETPAGRQIAGFVVTNRRDQAPVTIDMGGAYGDEVYSTLTDNGVDCARHKGGKTSTARSKSGNYGFFNKRAEVYWRFREALDPSQEGGSPVALPPDPTLKADLAAVQIKDMDGRTGIRLEPKEDLIEKLGRSPDRGDAVVLAWGNGTFSAQRRDGGATGEQRGGQQGTRVLTGRSARRR
jgi:hypothetical protein